MEVTVNSRGKAGFSIHWINRDGKKCDEFLGRISREEAWKKAGRKEAELEGVVIKRYQWKEFREKFELIYYRTLRPATISKQGRALDLVEKYIRPEYLDEITSVSICELCAKLPMNPETIRSYIGHIRVALYWAKRMQMIRELPEIQLPRGKDDPSKGRPLTEDEVRSMLDAVPNVRKRPSDVEKYQALIRGILLCGMRIEEIVALEWNNEKAPVWIDTSRNAWIITYNEQKGHRKTSLPALPEFHDFLSAFPRRTGRVFRLNVIPLQCSKILSAIGKSAKIVVSTNSRFNGLPKYASAHDLRRTFAARWAEVLPESILAAIMRHRSPETTRKHYAIMDAERILHAVEEATRRRGE